MWINIRGEKIEYELLIDRHRIQQRIGEIAKEISFDYRDKDNLTLLTPLNGGIFFLTDLSRKVGPLVNNLKIDTTSISSYGLNTESNGHPRIDLEPKESIAGKNVVLVEDVADKGYTIDKLIRNLEKQNPVSLKVAVLLDKPEGREIEVPLDYVGFIIPKRYVMGMGLDDAGLGRWLKDVWMRKIV